MNNLTGADRGQEVKGLLILLLCLLVIFCLEMLCGWALFKPQVIAGTTYVAKPVPIEVEREVVGVEIVEVPRKLRTFQDTRELERWLEKNGVDHRLYLVEKTELSSYDCDDFARNLAKQAIEDGYYMWVQILHHPYRRHDNNQLLTRPGEAHAICSVFIGNDCYYVEPQTDEYWLAIVVD